MDSSSATRPLVNKDILVTFRKPSHLSTFWLGLRFLLANRLQNPIGIGPPFVNIAQKLAIVVISPDWAQIIPITP